MKKMWFVTDIHGNSKCFRKFLNATRTSKAPDFLIIGGDITGKLIVPIVKQANSTWLASIDDEVHRLTTDAEVTALEERLADIGAYGFRCQRDEAEQFAHDSQYQDEVIQRLKVQRLQQWMEMADTRLKGVKARVFVSAGNDDPYYLDEVLDSSQSIERPDGRFVELDDFTTMISLGLANQTPWNCPRDFPEEELARRIDALAANVPDMSRCVFNFHCPPYGTSLDIAAKLDENFSPRMTGLGVEEQHVGSTAVRAAIEKYQPVASLHGHIHEQSSTELIGRTVCANPGSEYHRGQLRGVLLQFERGQLCHYALTHESA